MAKLLYSAITSLDGFIEDRDGNFDWGAPDEEVHTFINELERRAGTYLYGRKMYESMVYWETAHTLAGRSPASEAFTTLWQAAEKIVYSRTLEDVASARTHLERSFDVASVQHLKATAERDITVGGADLAAQALRAGLVDEVHLFTTPVLVGGGKPALPEGVCLTFTLLELRRFESGVVHRCYASAALDQQ